MSPHPVSERSAPRQPGFELGSGERVAAALSRALEEDLRWIAAAINEGDTARVHALRRRLKRCRAVLRGLAPAAPPAAASVPD